jgi:Mlc titration factor MtfA (ptsG expression regulator)
MTDEIRVTIAAHAALLLLGGARGFFPGLVSILVYPSAYRGKVTQRLPSGIIEEGEQGRLGESWHDGVVVLSWDDTLRGAADTRDGHNVVLHEFAHQLDQEDGTADGTPYLGRRSLYAAWARVLGADFERLREGPGVLDRYGATNPAEFFAVATETFFEKPHQLRAQNGELYEQLRAYYGVDPATDPPR